MKLSPEADPDCWQGWSLVSSLFQLILSTRLYLLRIVITPVISSTVIMLITVTVMPTVFNMLDSVPAGTNPVSGLLAQESQ